MRILVTGVAGLLGSHIADRMLELGHEVVGVDNLIGGYMDNVNEKVRFYKADCGDLELMNEYIKDAMLFFMQLVQRMMVYRFGLHTLLRKIPLVLQ